MRSIGRPSKGDRLVVMVKMPGVSAGQLMLEAAQRGLALSDLCALIAARDVGLDLALPPKAHLPGPDVLHRVAQLNPDQPKRITVRLPRDIAGKLEPRSARGAPSSGAAEALARYLAASGASGVDQQQELLMA